jgi:hypothetical protein
VPQGKAGGIKHTINESLVLQGKAGGIKKNLFNFIFLRILHKKR